MGAALPGHHLEPVMTGDQRGVMGAGLGLEVERWREGPGWCFR